MSMYKHKPCQPRAVSIFCIVPIPIFQLLPQQDFFFDFVMLHFPLHPSPISFKCSLISPFLLKIIPPFIFLPQDFSPEVSICFFSVERI